MSKETIVTDGAGFIGRHFIKGLLKEMLQGLSHRITFIQAHGMMERRFIIF